MKNNLSSCFRLAAALLVSSAGLLGQAAVAIENEPAHRLKFSNDFVRVFDVLIPKGSRSLFHIHLYDGISVRISDVEKGMFDEEQGRAESPFSVAWGAATYGVRPSPMTHRVINNGTADFRNIFIELLPASRAAAAKFPVLSDGHTVLIDNDRARVNRLTLKPGESSRRHVHPMHGLGIIVRDARIEITAAGAAPRVIDAKAGDTVWQAAGTDHTIRNIGATTFEAVDIEIK